MSILSNHRTALHQYVEVDEGYYAAYEAYEPDAAALMRVNVLRPEAHVVVASRRSCSDCARHIPPMTRVAELLPGWTWDIFSTNDDPERGATLKIKHVPTFIVYDREGGRELGRIVEHPLSGSLELDLLHIVQSAK